MTSQQFADELLIHWRLLWPLKATERAERIDEIAKDIVYREQLNEVQAIMEAA